MSNPEASPDPAAAHAVLAVIEDIDEAKSLIEDLEREGIPRAAISLVDPSEHPARERPSNRRIGGTVGRSVLTGIVAGLLLGGLAGLAVDAVTDLFPSRVWAVALGGVFGACIGIAGGGMLAVRYASPAWRAAQQTEGRGRLAVGVHHDDPSVIDSAEDVMAAHHPRRLHRQDR